MTVRGQEAATRASAAVFVGGRREASAVLVAESFLLTAAHVVPGPGQDREILVELPGVRPGERLATRTIFASTSGSTAEPDVAVLALLDPPVWLPEPVELRSALRQPERVEVFGFPAEERELIGVWREFDVAGPVAGAPAAQLRWSEDAGTLPGHSGGAVLDLDTGSLAGILIEGSTHGRFDRYVPTHVAQQCWEDLPRPWLLLGPEGRDHFERRALGQRGGRRAEDLFHGRDAALRHAHAWMVDDDPPGVPLIVTGQPGAGKSAVLARTVLNELEARGIGPGLAIHARDVTHEDVLDAVGHVGGAPRKPTRREVVDALERTVPACGRWLVVVDALDEAASDLHELARTLRELAELDTVRILVATRQRRAGARFGAASTSSLLTALAADEENLVDLDSDRFFDRDDLTRYVETLLAQKGPRGRAWSSYRADDSLRRRLAGTIANRSDRNYLVAVMAAEPLNERRTVVDPAEPDFDPTSIPSTVGDALDHYLRSLPGEARHARRGVLTALAYARGDGLDDPLWRRFAETLGYPIVQADLDALRFSAAADYLLQTRLIEAGGRRVTRLFHQALVDQLLADPDSTRDRAADESALTAALRAASEQQSRDVVVAAYTRAHLAEHAAAAGVLGELVTDVEFVLGADLRRLLPLLRDPALSRDPASATLRRATTRAASADPRDRAQLIALSAAHLGHDALTRRYAERSGPLRVRWAHRMGAEHEELRGHIHVVHGSAFGRLTDDRVVLATAGADLTVRLWDPETGAERGVLRGHAHRVTDVVFGRLGNGDPVLASASLDRSVRLWDPHTRADVGVLTGHRGGVLAVDFGRLTDGRPVLVSADRAGTVLLWDLEERTWHTIVNGRRGAVTSVAVGRLADGRSVLAAADRGGMVELWDLGTGTRRARLAGHREPVTSVAFGQLVDRRPILASAGADARIRLWLPDSGAERTTLTGHDGPVTGVAFGRATGGGPVLASVGADSSVRLWNLDSGTADAVLTGHTDHVNSVAFGRMASGRPVLATTGADRTVRLWNPDTTTDRGATKVGGHTGTVTGVASGRLADGRAGAGECRW